MNKNKLSKAKEKKIRKNKRILFSLMIMLFTILTIQNSLALPSPATEFYGVVTINDTPANSAINITAYDSDSVLCGQFTITTSGYFGLLSCNGDDSSTSIDEGAQVNEEIIFYVNSSRAVVFGDPSWESGEYIFLNLSVKNYPPFFLHNFSDQYINESSIFYYDVNCSDLNVEDNLTYYSNSTRFNISLTTGIITWIPSDEDVGNITFQITCSDGTLNVSENLTIIVKDVNNAPVLDYIASLIAIEDVLFRHTVTATDSDVNDTLNFSSNSTLFDINSSTGLIEFTPTTSQIGNYTINISVSDGVNSDFQIVYLAIVRGPYCGDKVCGPDEDCSLCPEDCGECPTDLPDTGSGAGSGDSSGGGTGTGGGGGSGGAGGAGGSARVDISGQEQRAYGICFERWECTMWSECSIDGIQTRKCADVYNCGTKERKPPESQACEYMASCFDGVQNGNETGIDCGGECEPCPPEPTCFDGIKNQGEEDIDCGGPCDACELIRYAKPPLLKLAPLMKSFPWLLFFIICLLLIISVASDRLYVKRITKSQFEEYRKKIRKYKHLQKRLYLSVILLAIIGLVYVIYLYNTSDNIELLVNYFWIPLIITLIVFIFVFLLITYISYYEYNRRKKSDMLFLADKKNKRDIILMEDNLLLSLESEIYDKTTHYLDGKIIKEEEFITQIEGMHNLLNNLISQRGDKIEPLILKDKLRQDASSLLEDTVLNYLSKEYIEFKDLKKYLKSLTLKGKVDGEGEIKKVENFLLLMAEISVDNHLMSVVKSNLDYIYTYNRIVDIYEECKSLLNNKLSKEETLSEKEKEYMQAIEGITKSRSMDKIQLNPKYTTLYNSLVDIYDHYKKKQLLKTELKQLERTSSR